MAFHEVSSDAEKLLHEVINNSTSSTAYTYSIAEPSSYIPKPYEKSLADELVKEGLCTFSPSLARNFVRLHFTGKGSEYFMRKKKYEEEQRMTSININASDNSPVNVSTGSGQANQTVTIYTAEQHNAINEFKEEVESSSLSHEDKVEVLELLDSMEELKAKNKTSSFKALVNRINEIVTTSNTLHAIWQGVVQLFL